MTEAAEALVAEKIEEMKAEVAANGFFVMNASRHSNRHFILTHTLTKWPGILSVNTTGFYVEGENFEWLGKNAKECLRYLDEVLTRHYKG